MNINEDAGFSPEESEAVRQAELKAVKLLEFSDKTEKQLRDKLKEGGFPPFAVDAAADYVKNLHYLDDARYAENYIRGRKDQKSKFEMTMELRNRGVDDSVLDTVLEEAEIDETETVRKLYLKKYGRMSEPGQTEFQKAVRYFAGKGFPYQAIRDGIALALDNCDENT